MFRLLAVGFALLTLTLASGIFFSERLFGKAVPLFGELWSKWYKPMIDACVKGLRVLARYEERQGREEGNARHSYITSKLPASDSSVPGVADFRRVGSPAFTDILQSVGDRDSGKILNTLVPELARDA